MPSGAAQPERFQFNGATLIDETTGTPTAGHLLFLHGWGGNRESLRGIATLFEHTHAVHLLDLPGFGDAPPPPDGWGTIDYADLVQQYVLDRLSGSIVLVGHSFGGRVAVRLAARRLPQVRGVVLMAVPGLPLAGWSRARVRRVAVRTLRRALVAIQPLVGSAGVQWHSRRFGSRDYQAAGALRPLLVRTVTEDLTESARAIACPTLLVWGSDDTETPLWLARRYAELLGDRATTVVLPHKDHHLYTGTGAHLCGEKIRVWLETTAHA